MSENLVGQDRFVLTGNMDAREFINLSIDESEKQLKRLGLAKDALLDPEEPFERQVAVLRYNYLLGERSALTFKINDPNFWRMLRARLQPMILAYTTHEKFVQSLDGDALDRKVKEMMEVYRERLATTEQFKDLFFNLKEQDGTVSTRVVAQPSNDVSEKIHPDGSGGIADVQANVINQLKESLKDQERNEKKLERKIKEQQEDLFRKDKNIAQLEEQQAELLAEIDRLSTENLQLKISIDASNKHDEQQTEEPPQSALVSKEEAPPANAYMDADKNELQLKIESLERDLENTSGAAYNAFMANSDLGIVILFVLTAFRCKSVNQLGVEVNRSLKTYGMSSVLRFKSETSTDFFGDDKVSDGDKMLFKNNENDGRIVDLGKNYLIYDTHTALLVKNMPTEDEERCGRLRDNLNTLMQAAETSANLITLNQSAEMQKQRMEALLVRSNAVFTKLSSNLDRNKAVTAAALKSFSGELRTQLNISPGGPQSAKLNAVSKKFQATVGSLFELEKMVDTSFVKNVSRVVETLKK